MKLEFDTANDRLKRLQQQERVWFAWVCRLHDLHSETQASHAPILAIAQRRWTEARRALQRAAQQHDGTRQPGRSAQPPSIAAKR